MSYVRSFVAGKSCRGAADRQIYGNGSDTYAVDDHDPPPRPREFVGLYTRRRAAMEVSVCAARRSHL